MADIFSTSFLLSVTVGVILIGGMFAYINFRVSEQDHKLNSMVSLVSALAQEVTYNKNVLSSFMSSNTNDTLTKKIELDNTDVNNSDLIEVSDDEEENEEEDEDDEDGEEEEDEEEEDEEADEDEEDEEDEDEEEQKQVNILGGDIDNTNEINIDDFFEDINNIDGSLSLQKDTSDLVSSNDDINEYHNTNTTEIKQIQITPEDFGSIIDYKKMSLNKLREIVVEKGLIQESFKLKKNELLKLLE